jgi:hypothetical protein
MAKPRPEFQVQNTEKDAFLSEATLNSVERLVERMFPPEPHQRTFTPLDSKVGLAPHICDQSRCGNQTHCGQLDATLAPLGWSCDAYRSSSSIKDNPFRPTSKNEKLSRRPVFPLHVVEDRPTQAKPSPHSPGYEDFQKDLEQGTIFVGTPHKDYLLERKPTPPPKAEVKAKPKKINVPAPTDLIRVLRQKGLTIRDIVATLNLSDGTVLKALNGESPMARVFPEVVKRWESMA